MSVSKQHLAVGKLYKLCVRVCVCVVMHTSRGKGLVAVKISLKKDIFAPGTKLQLASVAHYPLSFCPHIFYEISFFILFSPFSIDLLLIPLQSLHISLPLPLSISLNCMQTSSLLSTSVCYYLSSSIPGLLPSLASAQFTYQQFVLPYIVSITAIVAEALSPWHCDLQNC